ncbi:unnamed protein product, partial [Prorocentrum cordatum]
MPMAVARRPSALTARPRTSADGLDFPQLCEALEASALTELNLAGAFIGSKWPALARVLQESRSVTACDLSSNALGDTGAELVARVLEANPLRTLRLGRNGIGRRGGLALSAALGRDEHLCHLDLSNNGFGEERGCR